MTDQALESGYGSNYSLSEPSSRGPMRIVSWNCNMGFEKKRDVVMSLQPDILVLQECSAKDIANTKAPFKHWVGSNTQKGLAIIGFANYEYTIDRSYTQEWPWFLPVRVEDVPLHILGLWACVKDHRLRYVRVTHQAVDHYARFLSVPYMIVIGDFNSNTIWDRLHREHSHSQLVAKLGKFGLVSAYHTLRGELQGQEVTPTQFMYVILPSPIISIMLLFHKHLVGLVTYSLENQANGFTRVTICRFFSLFPSNLVSNGHVCSTRRLSSVGRSGESIGRKAEQRGLRHSSAFASGLSLSVPCAC